MPIYEYRCTCGVSRDEYRTVATRDEAPVCCGNPMTRAITAAMVAPDIGGYQSVVDGSYIGSRSAHREHLKKHDLVELGNERIKPKPKGPPPGLKEAIVSATKART